MSRRNEYVPKVPSSNGALLVALLLHHVPGTQGMTKESLVVMAEETGVSTESMSGDGSFYDGWSGMKQLQQGDPALVRREKGHRYSLTTQVNPLFIVSCFSFQHMAPFQYVSKTASICFGSRFVVVAVEGVVYVCCLRFHEVHRVAQCFRF